MPGPSLSVFFPIAVESAFRNTGNLIMLAILRIRSRDRRETASKEIFCAITQTDFSHPLRGDYTFPVSEGRFVVKQ